MKYESLLSTQSSLTFQEFPYNLIKSPVWTFISPSGEESWLLLWLRLQYCNIMERIFVTVVSFSWCWGWGYLTYMRRIQMTNSIIWAMMDNTNKTVQDSTIIIFWYIHFTEYHSSPLTAFHYQLFVIIFINLISTTVISIILSYYHFTFQNFILKKQRQYDWENKINRASYIFHDTISPIKWHSYSRYYILYVVAHASKSYHQ